MKKWLVPFLNVPAVIVPIFNAFDDVVACIESLLVHTPKGVPILALDDASTDKRISTHLSAIQNHRFLYVQKQENSGFVTTVNMGFSVTTPSDVIVVNSDVIVPSEWFERLQSAAYYRSNIATATPFTNYGSIVSIPHRNQPGNIPDNQSLYDIDNQVRRASLKKYPPLPTAIGHCVYFRRTALDVVGFFDEVFSPGYGEEVDFSQRAVMAGFVHVLADDLFVYHRGSRSFSTEKLQIQREHEKIIRKRYPWYHKWSARIATSQHHPLAISIERAITAITQYRIVIDATYINESITGTQIHTIELIRALANLLKDKVQLSIIIQDGVDVAMLQGIEQLVENIITLTDVKQYPQHYFHLAHRNFQIRDEREFKLLLHLAQRVVVSQLDLISFSNPAYATNVDDWLHYVDLTRWILDVVDGVIYNSADVVASALHQGIHTPSERMQIIYPGVNHNNHKGNSISDLAQKITKPFVLMLGADFRHKNRIFGLKILKQLIAHYDWNGDLVLAGPSVHYGSSKTSEEKFLKDNPNLITRVHYLSAVNDTEKQWLFSNTSLLLYPSIYEGFGMVPFEVAQAGSPALTTNMTSLGEVLGKEILYLNSFDTENETKKVWELITDPIISKKQIQVLCKQQKKYTWVVSAEKTWKFYKDILALPPRYEHENIEQLFGKGLSNNISGTKPTLPKWRHLLADSFYILFTDGLSSLLKEIRQYLRWLWIKR